MQCESIKSKYDPCPQPMTTNYQYQWSSNSNQNSWRSQPQSNYGSVPVGSSGVQVRRNPNIF